MMYILCDKKHEHPAWRDGYGRYIAERVGTCYLIITKVV